MGIIEYFKQLTLSNLVALTEQLKFIYGQQLVKNQTVSGLTASFCLRALFNGHFDFDQAEYSLAVHRNRRVERFSK